MKLSKPIAIIGILLALGSLGSLVYGVINQRWQVIIGSLLILGALWFAVNRVTK